MGMKFHVTVNLGKDSTELMLIEKKKRKLWLLLCQLTNRWACWSVIPDGCNFKKEGLRPKRFSSWVSMQQRWSLLISALEWRTILPTKIWTSISSLTLIFLPLSKEIKALKCGLNKSSLRKESSSNSWWKSPRERSQSPSLRDNQTETVCLALN